MKDKLKEFIKLLFSLLCFYGIGYVITFILKLFNISTKDLSPLWMMILELLLALIVSSIVMAVYYKEVKKDFGHFKKNLDKNITYIIKMFLIFMVVKYIISVLSVLLMMGIGYDTTSMTSANQSTIEEYVKSFPWIMVFTTSFVAPLYEETLFRLGFKKVIKNKIAFILISGFIFGLMHIFPLAEGVDLILGLLQSITYVTMGIFLAYSYQKTNNIFTSIGIHFLNNFLSVLTMINMM